MTLVGHWPLTEWNGQANDLSGEGNHGTVNGPTQGVWGRGGLTGYHFDGTDDYIDVPNSVASKVDGSSNFTLSCWVRPDGTDMPHQYFALLENADTRLYATGGNEYTFYMHDGNSAQFITYAPSPYTDTWAHVVGVFDKSDGMSLYVDGQQRASNNFTGTTRQNAGDALFGAIDFGSGRQDFHEGVLTDMRFYQRPLSPSEIQTLYEWGSKDYTKQSLHNGTDSGAVSRYEFESGSVTTDSWGSNTLTDNTSAGTTSDAIRGQAKSFDGTDDEMNFGSPIISDVNTSFTVSLWVHPSDVSGSQVFASEWNTNDSNSNAWLLDNNSTGGDVRFAVRDSAGNFRDGASKTGAITTGAWYHLAGTASGNGTTLYVNGTPVATGIWDETFGASQNFYVGSYENTVDFYNGDIDDLRVYDRALSSAEVAQLYRQGHGRDMRHRMVRK